MGTLGDLWGPMATYGDGVKSTSISVLVLFFLSGLPFLEVMQNKWKLL